MSASAVALLPAFVEEVAKKKIVRLVVLTRDRNPALTAAGGSAASGLQRYGCLERRRCFGLGDGQRGVCDIDVIDTNCISGERLLHSNIYIFGSVPAARNRGLTTPRLRTYVLSPRFSGRSCSIFGLREVTPRHRAGLVLRSFLTLSFYKKPRGLVRNMINIGFDTASAMGPHH